jgi:hypothetical protein
MFRINPGFATPVLRTRDVLPGSRIQIFPSWIPGQKDSKFRIRIRIKECQYF